MLFPVIRRKNPKKSPNRHLSQVSRGQDENGSETVRGLVCVGTRVRADCCEICARRVQRGEFDVVVDVDSDYLLDFSSVACGVTLVSLSVSFFHLSVRRWRLPSLIIFPPNPRN